jgi:hypothetical protein
MRHLILATCLLLANCGPSRFPDAAKDSELTGELLVMWLDDGGDELQRQGRFIYVPSRSDPLRLIRSDPAFPVIEPQRMYTDGGSIPSIAQGFRGFSPWSYAPAYVMHDYLFLARACAREGKPDKAPLPGIERMELTTAADILAETIKTLKRQGRVVQDDLAPILISSAVNGPVSRGKWEGGTTCEALSDIDNLRVDAVFSRSAAAKLRNTDTEAGDPLPIAEIVGVLSF